jgi:hypothetical protein
MKIEHVEVLVEEPSMEAALAVLLPKMLGEISFQIHTHQSKHDLLATLLPRLRGYATWVLPNHRLLVVVDRDQDECSELKGRLDEAARVAGLKTRTEAGISECTVVNRIAVEELEAWYFGDWNAVRSVYPRVPETIPSKAPFRNPDGVAGGTWEAFERILQKAGYFKGGLRKIEAARMIAPHMNPDANTSPSFAVFRSAVTEMSHICQVPM